LIGRNDNTCKSCLVLPCLVLSSRIHPPFPPHSFILLRTHSLTLTHSLTQWKPSTIDQANKANHSHYYGGGRHHQPSNTYIRTYRVLLQTIEQRLNLSGSSRERLSHVQYRVRSESRLQWVRPSRSLHLRGGQRCRGPKGKKQRQTLSLGPTICDSCESICIQVTRNCMKTERQLKTKS